MKLTRRAFTQTVLNAGATLPAFSSGKRPNILFILTDDQRFDGLGCAGNTSIQTPNIDKLAKEGIFFRNSFVTTAICCCSRATALTGQYMRRHGVEGFDTPLSESQFSNTYMAQLRKAGYRTALLGKYAIGNPTKHPGLALPKDQFDFWYGFPQSINFLQRVDDKPKYLTSLMVEKAEGFLRSLEQDNPFCMALHFKEPHGPWNFFDPDRPDTYKAAVVKKPTTQTRADYEAQPDFIRKSLNGLDKEAWDEDTDAHFAKDARTCYHLVSGVDVAVGKVMKVLKELGRDENTMVIFTSDNGNLQGEHGLQGKWIMYEESIRVPLIIRDPRLPAKLRGGVRDQMALNIDLAPTMLRMAGVPVPGVMQGRDLGPVLQNARQPWREDWFYEHTYKTVAPRRSIASSEGVRTTKWKYIRYTDQTPVFEQLFDLVSDPTERNNLALVPAHLKTLQKLRKRCASLRTEAA